MFKLDVEVIVLCYLLSADIRMPAMEAITADKTFVLELNSRADWQCHIQTQSQSPTYKQIWKKEQKGEDSLLSSCTFAGTQLQSAVKLWQQLLSSAVVCIYAKFRMVLCIILYPSLRDKQPLNLRTHYARAQKTQLHQWPSVLEGVFVESHAQTRCVSQSQERGGHTD